MPDISISLTGIHGTVCVFLIVILSSKTLNCHWLKAGHVTDNKNACSVNDVLVNQSQLSIINIPGEY